MRTSSINFKGVNPELAKLFDVAELFRMYTPDANFLTGKDVKPADLLTAPLENQALCRAYYNYAMALTQQEVPQEFVKGPSDEMFLLLARYSIVCEAEMVYDPRISRPPMSFGERLMWVSWMNQIKENYGNLPWMTNEFILGWLTHWISRAPHILNELLDLYLDPPSAGWLNSQEREGALKAVEGAIGDESHYGLLDMWEKLGGSKLKFESVWNKYFEGMLALNNRILTSYANREVRRGLVAYENLFRKMGIGHAPEQVLQWGHERYAELEQEMDRLAVKMGYDKWQTAWTTHPVEPLPKGEELLTLYRQTTEQVIDILQINNLLPVAPDKFNFVVTFTPPSDREGVPVALCYIAPYKTDERVAQFCVTPPENDEMLVRQHRFNLRLTSAHEIGGHGFGSGLAPLQVTVEAATSYIGGYGMEGIAFGYENAFLRCPEANPTIEEGFTMLVSRAWRAARIIAEMEWHMTDKPLPTLVAEYASRSGMSVKMAQRDIRRALQETGPFLYYYLGAAGVWQLGKYYPDSNALEALADYQASSVGCIPPHWYAKAKGFISDPTEFDWLTSYDPGVKTTQMLFA